MKPARFVLLIVGAATLAAPTTVAAASLGSGFTYQGQVKKSGAPISGTCDLQFSLWDTAGTGSPPSGGTQIGATQTVSGATVTNGLFTVELNAAGEFGTGAFAGSARWLQIAVRSPAGSGSYTTLAPRQKLTASPFALFAAGPWGLSGTNVFYTGGHVGIGTSAPGADLDVHGDAIVDTQYGRLGVEYGPTGNGWRWALGALGTTLELDECPAGGGANPRLVVTAGGKLGIGSMAPTAPLEVQAAQAWEQLTSTTAGNGSVLQLKNLASSPSYYGAINFADSAGNVPGQIGYLGSDALTFRTDGSERVRIDASGKVGIGTTSPQEGLSLNSGMNVDQANAHDGGAPNLKFGNASGEGIGSKRTAGGNQYGLDFYTGFVNRMAITQAGDIGIGTSVPAAKLHVSGTIRGKVLEITAGADLAEPFVVNSHPPTGPALTADNAPIPPRAGMVVVIDPDHPGQLKLSTLPYDRKVAGIISGAKGLNPGMVMKSDQSRDTDGDCPVALTGRVYVWADASYGAIEPGDMLTTSATAGHAMKATDRDKAFGAVIGKAMQPLKQGKGLILVLVGLQ